MSFKTPVGRTIHVHVCVFFTLVTVPISTQVPSDVHIADSFDKVRFPWSQEATYPKTAFKNDMHAQITWGQTYGGGISSKEFSESLNELEIKTFERFSVSTCLEMLSDILLHSLKKVLRYAFVTAVSFFFFCRMTTTKTEKSFLFETGPRSFANS